MFRIKISLPRKSTWTCYANERKLTWLWIIKSCLGCPLWLWDFPALVFLDNSEKTFFVIGWHSRKTDYINNGRRCSKYFLFRKKNRNPKFFFAKNIGVVFKVSRFRGIAQKKIVAVVQLLHKTTVIPKTANRRCKPVLGIWSLLFF